MAVDILPTSIPRDSSEHFSSLLNDYLRVLVHEYHGKMELEKEGEHRKEALQRATIAREGRLAGRHAWLKGSVDAWRQALTEKSRGQTTASPGQRKKVLMLGSGMVARPAVGEIAKRTDLDLLVG